MTLSREERDANVKLALQLMLDKMGDEWANAVYFDRHDSVFENILDTTWKELKDSHYVDDAIGFQRSYRLTSFGWVAALKCSGLLGSRELSECVGRLAAALKRFVEGRHQGKYVSVEEVAVMSGLPEGFVANAIDSSLIEVVLTRQGASWVYRNRGLLINVPITVGFNNSL
jgi:hypothetical protein